MYRELYLNWNLCRIKRPSPRGRYGHQFYTREGGKESEQESHSCCRAFVSPDKEQEKYGIYFCVRQRRHPEPPPSTHLQYTVMQLHTHTHRATHDSSSGFPVLLDERVFGCPLLSALCFLGRSEGKKTSGQWQMKVIVDYLLSPFSLFLTVKYTQSGCARHCCRETQIMQELLNH